MSTKKVPDPSEETYHIDLSLNQVGVVFNNVENLAAMLECQTNGADAQLVRTLFREREELLAQRQYLLHQLKELCAEHNCVNPDLRSYYSNALAHLKLS